MCSWPRKSAGLLLGAGLLAPAFTAGQALPPDPRTREQLFEQVFGRPPPPMPVSGHVLVVLDGQAPEKVAADFSGGEGGLRVDAKGMLALLAPVLQPAALQRLQRSADAQGWLGRAELEAAGVATQFEARRFQLALAIDPRARLGNVRYLAGAPPDRSRAVQPAGVSAFLNLNARTAQRKDEVQGAQHTDTPTALSGDGAVNVHGYVLEGSGYSEPGSGRGFHRGEMRLVHDRPEDAVRFMAGDLRFPVVGFQTIVQMGGIGVSRNFSLQPYRRGYQSSQFEFYLERPALVRVWVNESLVSTLQLPAGTHDIRGISPAPGLNNTRLVIEEASGRTQTLNFAFVYSPLLLPAGNNLFSWNAGFRRNVVDGRYEYDTGSPVVSAAYLKGWTGQTTAGGYLQADSDRAVLGADLVHAMERGSIELDAATRVTRGAPSGLGVRANWVYGAQQGPAPGWQLQFGAEYLSRYFGSVNEAVPAARDRVNLFSSAAWPIDAANGIQLAAYYTPSAQQGRPTTYNVSAAWTRRLGRALLTLGLRDRRNSRGEEDRGIFFGLSYAFSQGIHNVHASKEIESDVMHVGWSTVRTDLATTPYAFASTRFGSGVREFDGGAGIWTHQGLLEATYARSKLGQDAAQFVREEAALRAQTAIVFADGYLGLAPFVAENFAIVRGKEGLSGVRMDVDPDGQGGSRGHASWASPAVLTDLGSYLVREVRVEPVNPPLGAVPDKLVYALGPGYKSGILLQLGKEARILAVGRIVDASGAGLAHVPVEVRRLGDTREPLRTFTGRNGAIQLPDMVPGRYEITPVAPLPWNTIIVDIEASPDGLARLGMLPASR